MSAYSTSRQRGFSLLEVLVAFVILSLSLGVMMRLFSASLTNVGAAERHAHAVAVAESALAGLGVSEPLAEGGIAGPEADNQGYRWRARVGRRDAAPAEDTAAIRLYQIELDVVREEETLLTLTTLRLAAAP